MLLPGTALPRHADATAVIGTALLAGARGGGHRRIAADLARPAVTVRRWLRAVRGEHAEWLRAAAIERLAALDRDVISTLAPTGSRLGDALNVVAAAALTHRARLARTCRSGIWSPRSPAGGCCPCPAAENRSGRALARPRAGATMTTTIRHLADYHSAP